MLKYIERSNMIKVIDSDGVFHYFKIEYLERIDFIKNTIHVIFKDNRQEKQIFKSKSVQFF